MQLVEPNITLLITNTTSTEEIFAANNTKNSSIELDKSTPKYDLQYTINKTMDGKIHCNLTNTALFYDDDEISTTDASSDIKWYHNGHEVDFDHRYVLDPYTEELNIISARVEDEGIWHCGDKTTGDVGQSVSLVVLGKLFFSFSTNYIIFFLFEIYKIIELNIKVVSNSFTIYIYIYI